MADFMDMLRFGPQNTMQAADGTPSIYADAEEWEAYRQQRQQEDLDILNAMDLRDADSERLLKTAENLQRPVTNRQPAPIQTEAPMGVNAVQPSKFDPAVQLQSVAAEAPQVRTGPKNAREDAINANTKAYGVQAFTDEKGQLVLTNKAGATDAKSAMAPFVQGDKTLQGNPAFYQAPGGAVAPNTPANVDALFKDLQTAKGFDDAAAIYSSLQNALADSKARLKDNAMRFAEQKAGIPQLQKSLEQNMYLDSQKRGGVPGLDSPITTQLRSQLNNAMQRVSTIAEGYLATNVNYATLTAKEKQADLYMSQQQKKGDAENNLRAQLKIRGEFAAEQQKAEDAAFSAAIPDYAKDRLVSLQPSLVAAGGDGGAAVTKAFKMAQRDKNLNAALMEPPEKLPVLAFTGNAYALDIIAAQEAKSTGRSKDEIINEFNSLKLKFSGKDGQNLMAQEMALLSGAPSKDKKQAIEDARLQLGQEKMAPEKADSFAQRQAMLALNYAKRTATDKFLSNAASWSVQDPEFQNALKKAMDITGGRPSVDAVLVAFNGSLTGKEAVEQHKKFLRFANLAAEKRQSALFGAPDPTAIQAAVQASLKEKIGILNRTALSLPQNPAGATTIFGLMEQNPQGLLPRLRFDNVPSIAE